MFGENCQSCADAIVGSENEPTIDAAMNVVVFGVANRL
jgi:hypothetical protein